MNTGMTVTVKGKQIEVLLARVSARRAELPVHRDEARAVAVRAIRALELRLVEALGTDRLRGMPNLLPDGAEDFRALRVNAWSKRWGSAEYLPRDGREVLVLASDGMLMVAHRVVADDGRVLPDARPVRDAELLVEDLEPTTRVIQEALEKHLAMVDRRFASFARAEALATTLIAAVGRVTR